MNYRKTISIILSAISIAFNMAAQSTWTDLMPENPNFSTLEKIDIKNKVDSEIEQLSAACPIAITPGELVLENVTRSGLSYAFSFNILKELKDLYTAGLGDSYLISNYDMANYILSHLATEEYKDLYILIAAALYTYYDIDFAITEAKTGDKFDIVLKQDGTIANSNPPAPEIETVEVTTISIVDDSSDNGSDTDDVIYVAVEEAAEFPGGTKAFSQWLSDNFVYPMYCYDNNIQGRVVVKFEIKKDGSIGKIELSEEAHPLMNKEAVRLVKSMPKWKAGKNNGVPVNSWFTLPITFKLSSGK